MHGLPPEETLAAVALASITGAVDMNRELNGSACWTRSVTLTWLERNALFAGYEMVE
jgi:hypothetical protein